MDNRAEIDAAFAALGPHKAGGLLVASDPLWSGHRSRIIALAARYVLPAIYYEPAWVAEANADSGTVSVIDTATNTVAATVPVGRRPFGIAIGPITR
jgi:YVTN family beta-propeller protein